MALCTYLEDINKTMKERSKNQLFEHFQTLLRVSILYTSTVHDNQLSVVVNILVSNMVQLIMSTLKWLGNLLILHFLSALQIILVSLRAHAIQNVSKK